MIRILWLVMMGLVWGCATPPPLQPPVAVQGGVQFTVDLPDAQTVAVAGNFNGWSSTTHPMTRSSSNGVWASVIPLPPGEYVFMYVVDGKEWVTPPLADDFLDDGFGGKNGVVVVR